MKIKQIIASLTFRILGWSVANSPTDEHKKYKKYLLISGPHTSNWDFVYGFIATCIWEMPIKFIIKKEAMVFPLGYLLKSLGAIPIDRHRLKNSRSNVDIISKQIEKYDEAVVAISPKGTRHKTDHIKTGFYYIAKQTNIPIALCYIDYKKRTIGLGPIYFVGDNVDEDVEKILTFYKNKTPKYLEQNLSIH